MTLLAQAAQEMLRRREAAASAVGFAEYIDVPGRPVDDDDEDIETFRVIETKLAAHHKMILDATEACFLKPYGRTMIFMPPGSAKSTYASVVGPSYLMGKYPRTRCGLFSYGGTLAKKFGRRTRSVVKQRKYQHVFPEVELSADSSAANEFTLTNGSEYMAAGILGAATGNRFNMLFIDDPIKGREDADSQTIRDKTWDAYEDDLKTRLVPGGSIVIIQTRWHEDDLSGRILPEGWNGESGEILCKDGNVWTVLCLQAECQTDSDPLGRARGEMLWPEWFTPEHWAQFRGNSRTWGALCQQLPRPADGNLFKPDMMEVIDAIPAGRITWVRGWDAAATEGGGDYTAAPKIGRISSGPYDGYFIVADVVRGQWGPDKRDKIMKNTAIADGRQCFQDYPQDPGAAGKSQVTQWVKNLPGYPIKFGPESGDKETRASPFAAQVNVGNVLLLRGDWNVKYKEELRSFPSGTYDDQVDGSSRAFNRLLEIAGKITINPNLLKRRR